MVAHGTVVQNEVPPPASHAHDYRLMGPPTKPIDSIIFWLKLWPEHHFLKESHQREVSFTDAKRRDSQLQSISEGCTITADEDDLRELARRSAKDEKRIAEYFRERVRKNEKVDNPQYPTLAGHKV